MNLEIAYQELSKSDFITTYGKGIYELCKQRKNLKLLNVNIMDVKGGQQKWHK